MGSPEFREHRAKAAASKPRAMENHPIAAIQKRVIDSEAFASLPASAVVTLLLLARNLEKGKNGHVFVSAEDAERHGIDRKTLYRQLRALVAAGFIYPTARGGNGRCSTYALTWLPLSKDTRGLHIENFKPSAWRDWKPPSGNDEKFFPLGKMSTDPGQERVKTTLSLDRNGSRPRDKSPYLELNTNTHGVERTSERAHGKVRRPMTTTRRAWIPAYVANLKRVGLAGRQCFEIPKGVTLQ